MSRDEISQTYSGIWKLLEDIPVHFSDIGNIPLKNVTAGLLTVTPHKPWHFIVLSFKLSHGFAVVLMIIEPRKCWILSTFGGSFQLSLVWLNALSYAKRTMSSALFGKI